MRVSPGNERGLNQSQAMARRAYSLVADTSALDRRVLDLLKVD